MRTNIDASWVTGFVEGAGSFTFHRGGDRVAPVFSVRMKSAGRGLLEELRSFFGDAGTIYATHERRACLYRVNRTRDLLRLVEHFDAHPLRGEKRGAFELWREMVLLRATHHGSPGPRALHALAERLARGAVTAKKNT